MTATLPPAETVLGPIPDPETVRAMLARAVREAELLRRLLRVSQRKAHFRPASEPEVLPCRAS